MKNRNKTYKIGNFEFHNSGKTKSEGSLAGIPPFSEILRKHDELQNIRGKGWRGFMLAGLSILAAIGISIGAWAWFNNQPQQAKSNPVSLNAIPMDSIVAVDSKDSLDFVKPAVAAIAVNSLLEKQEIQGGSTDVVENRGKDNEAILEAVPFRKVWFAPVLDWDPEFQSFELDADKASMITFEGGSTIQIPANAFEDSIGNTVHGKITIRLRNIKDAIDMMAAGIPMKYPAGGKNTWLQSAGMFEIRGFQDGKEIRMAMNKEMKVNQRSFISGDYGIYYLNDTTGNWQFIRKPKLFFDAQEKERASGGAERKKGCAIWTGIVNLFSKNRRKNEVNWQEDFNSQRSNVADTLMEYGNVRREFGINKFGVWNSDNPFKPLNAVNKNGGFNLDSMPLNSIVYQVEVNTNTLMSNYLNSGQARLIFNPAAQNIWFYVDAKSKTIAWMDAAEFQRQYLIQRKESTLTFNLLQIEQTFKSVKEIREYILGKNIAGAIQ